jgi:hypothetical protein
MLKLRLRDHYNFLTLLLDKFFAWGAAFLFSFGGAITFSNGQLFLDLLLERILTFTIG